MPSKPAVEKPFIILAAVRSRTRTPRCVPFDELGADGPEAEPIRSSRRQQRLDHTGPRAQAPTPLALLSKPPVGLPSGRGVDDAVYPEAAIGWCADVGVIVTVGDDIAPSHSDDPLLGR